MTALNAFQDRDLAMAEMRQVLHAEQFLAEWTEGGSDEVRWFQFSAVPGADYCWSLWFYANGERHIYASLRPQSGVPSDDDDVVWYHPFEPEDYSSGSDLEAAFRSEVLRVFGSFTRVRRTRYRVNWSIELESSADSSIWNRVYGFRALRAGWGGRSTANWNECLSSPPLRKD